MGMWQILRNIHVALIHIFHGISLTRLTFASQTQEQKDRFEDEVRETNAEYAKMEGHIRYYISEMCKSMAVEAV